ncbi:ataxin-7-like protein 3 [Mytilus galloprovincialis]|uniref:ataxin-7-like protein 3 n=1 Tax=Mytilus edulis TaxID=6550 RepID=UPI0039F1040E
MGEEKSSFQDINPELLKEVMNEVIDEVTLGLCFEVHRAYKKGTLFLADTDPKSQKDFEIVDRFGVDVFGQLPTKKQFECICPSCHRNMAASRFAPHLEKCMGMGRNSSRIASRRQAAQLARESNDRPSSAQGKRDSDESPDDDNDVDWSYHVDKKLKKLKKDKMTNSPRRNKNKIRNGDSFLERSVTPEPNYEMMTIDERKNLLTHTCGVISEHTKKMCTRSHRCPQHSDEQRIQVRQFLISGDDDVHIDIDTLDDPDSESVRDALWEENSTSSSPAGSIVSTTSLAIKKRPAQKASSKSKVKKKKPNRPIESIHNNDELLANSNLYDFE